jgi:hypothetical protein
MMAAGTRHAGAVSVVHAAALSLAVGLLFCAGTTTTQSAAPSLPAGSSECVGYLVRGAGAVGVNGCYKQASTPVCGSSPGFVLDAAHTLYFYGSSWRLGLCGKNVTYLATQPSYRGAPPAQTTATCGAVWATQAGAAPCPAVIRSNLPPVPPPPTPAPPPPPPSPPSPPPWCTTPGEERPCFHNHGTKYVNANFPRPSSPSCSSCCCDAPALSRNRSGVSKSYDCEVRKHAYEYAKVTLPERSSFRSAYDALQLHACGVPAPETDDVYTAPTFPTPKDTPVIYVDSNAPAATAGSDSGSGSHGDKFNPFKTLEAAVASITARSYPVGPKTIVLKAGTYYTAGVVLTTDHANLTIQNYEGAAVVVSGAVPIRNSKSKWSIYNQTTNTWKLDTKGQRLGVEYGMRIGDKRSEGGTRRAIRAKFPNGDPETAPSFCFIGRPGSYAPLDIGTYAEGSGVSMELPRYFPREHDPINTTQTFTANPWDWPSVDWHKGDRLGIGPYFYAAGGVCSGRTPAHGYWCSADNPRGRGGAQHNVNPPGGFEYRTVLPQAAKYSNPKGAIFHARGGSEPYFTYMCLVTHVANGSVHFDPAVGCDQGAQGLSNGRAWDWYLENVKEECDSPGEYYFDAEEEALYYTFNGTDAPTGTEELALTQVILLFFVFNLWITISPWRSPGSVEVIHRQTP